MRKLFILLTLSFFSQIYAQKLKKSDLLNIEKNIYKEAMSNFDLDAAKNSVYHILAIEGNSSSYLDSLAYIYFRTQKYASTVKVANKILEKKDDISILEIKAIALENLNLIKEAISIYEKMFMQKKSPALAYKLASLQSQLKRSAEAFATLKSVENMEFPKDVLVPFPSAQKGKQQQVFLKAAYYNLLAMNAYELHNYDLAIKYFDEALKIKPDFFVAKQNKQAIELMRKKLENQSPPQPPKNNKPPKANK